MGKKTRKKATNKKSAKPKRRKSVKDDRIRIIFGLLIVAFAFLLLISQLSYLFTWKVDQSFELNPFKWNPDVRVDNWAGKTGAYLAYILMDRWFGLASFTIPFIVALIGLRYLRIRPLPLFKTILITSFATLFLSMWLGLFSQNGDSTFGSGLGGRHGHFLTLYFISLVGLIGTIVIYLVFTFGLLIFINNKILKFIINLIRNNSLFKGSGPAFEDESSINQRPGGTVTFNNTNADDSDLVFETEFPQHEKQADDNLFKIRTTESANFQTGKQSTEHEKDIELTVEKSSENDQLNEKKIGSEPLQDYDPTLELSYYKLPPLDLLEKHDAENSSVTNEELVSNKNKIVETLGHYKIRIDKIKATIGPTVTLYEIVPAPGVRISKIKNLEDDIALNLSALGIRIIAPIPGKGTIGIEVPNQQPEIVSMRSLISSRKFQESSRDLSIALGKTISNETYVFDLAKMPHLLVAGATGQGKSVGLNVIIASLLYKKHPAQLKFVLIDPKKVELTLYSKIEKHFLAKIPDSDETIITDTQKVIYTLNSLCIEMDQRYDLLKKAEVRNIKEYNEKFIKRRLNPEKGHRYLPYIVVIIDEFADLIMTAGREVETPIARLAQLARAIGIHLVIATQRPTTNIITGVIKANFPARIAFRVTSMIDSRTILDSPGANQLVGRGDLLFAPGSDMIRLQCAFIDIPELERITEYINSQQAYPTPFYLPEYIDDSSSDTPGEVDLSKKDALFNDAARLVVAHQQGSTSLIQRKFSIGYNRAGRIVDQLEAAGIVGPFEGSKARQVLMPDEYTLEQYLRNLEQ